MTAKGIWNVVVSSPKVISNSKAGGRGGRREGVSSGLWVGGMKEMCGWLGLGLQDKKYNGGMYYCQVTANAIIGILEAQESWKLNFRKRMKSKRPLSPDCFSDDYILKRFFPRRYQTIIIVMCNVQMMKINLTDPQVQKAHQLILVFIKS